MSNKILKISREITGGSTDGGANRRIQGSILAIRQERRWHHHYQGTGYRYEVAWTEPHRGRATRHDQ